MEPLDIVGIFIFVGILISYLPQYWKIISSGTSKGISHYFLFIGLIGSVSTFFNKFIFDTDIILECKSNISFEECTIKLLRFLQVGIQLLCIIIFYLLFIIYLPAMTNYLCDVEYLEPIISSGISDVSFTSIKSTEESPTLKVRIKTIFNQMKRIELVMFFIAIFLTLVIGSISMIFTFMIECNEEKGDVCIVWAQILGYISIGLVFIQYLPQIYEIYTEKKIGSISMLTLIIQVCGSILWTTYLILGLDVHFTTWLPFLVTSFFQTILLSLCTYFEIKRVRYQREVEEIESYYREALISNINNYPEDDYQEDNEERYFV